MASFQSFGEMGPRLNFQPPWGKRSGTKRTVEDSITDLRIHLRGFKNSQMVETVKIGSASFSITLQIYHNKYTALKNVLRL